MSAQTSYSIKQAVAYAGMVFAEHPHDIDSRDVETAAGIDFGVAVSRGTDADRQVVLGGDAAFFGITIRSLEREGAVNTNVAKYAEKETAGILRRGYIWVTVPSGCTPGDSVKYNDTTGVIDAGAAGAGETQLTGAQFETTAAAGGLAVLKLESTANT